MYSIVVNIDEKGKGVMMLNLKNKIFGKIKASGERFYWMPSLIIGCVYSVYCYLSRITVPEYFLHVLIIAALFMASICLQGVIVGRIIKSNLLVLLLLNILNMTVWIFSGYSWTFNQNVLPAKIYDLMFPYMPIGNGLRTFLVEQGALYYIRGFLKLKIIQLELFFIATSLLLKYKLRHRQFAAQQLLK